MKFDIFTKHCNQSFSSPSRFSGLFLIKMYKVRYIIKPVTIPPVAM